MFSLQHDPRKRRESHSTGGSPRGALTIFLEEALIIFYRAGLSQLSQNPPPAVAITSNQAAFAKGIQCGLRMAEGEASCDCNICLRNLASADFVKAGRLCR